MPQTKSIVIGCIAMVLLAGVLVACGVGGIFMLGITGVVEKAEQAGVEFGKSTDQQGCQDEAFRHLRAAIKSHDLLKDMKSQYSLMAVFNRASPQSDIARMLLRKTPSFQNWNGPNHSV